MPTSSPENPIPPVNGRLAVYAGSFDPLTLGHLDVIRRATLLFDRVLVAVGSHPKKRPLFSAEERVEMIQTCVKDLPTVGVTSFTGLTVDLCRAEGATAMVRGLRASTDFDSEFQLGLANRDLYPELETVFLLPDLRHQFVSSSLVRELALFGGDAHRYVMPNVAAALDRRMKELSDGSVTQADPIDSAET